MRSRLVAAGAALGLAAIAGLAVPAAAAAQAKPRAGSYSGTETGALGAGSAVTFTVAKNRARLRAFTANAPVKAGCKGPYAGYQAPTGPMPIGKAGRFAASTAKYPGPKVRITVTGHFTSPTTASGHIIVSFTRLKGCNATVPFTVKRTP